MEDVKIYYADIDTETNIVKGFYCKEIHGDNIPAGVVAITEELWQELLSYGQAKADAIGLSAIPKVLGEEPTLTIEHKDYFSRVEPEVLPTPPSEVSMLREELEELKKTLSQLLSNSNL